MVECAVVADPARAREQLAVVLVQAGLGGGRLLPGPVLVPGPDRGKLGVTGRARPAGDGVRVERHRAQVVVCEAGGVALAEVEELAELGAGVVGQAAGTLAGADRDQELGELRADRRSVRTRLPPFAPALREFDGDRKPGERAQSAGGLGLDLRLLVELDPGPSRVRGFPVGGGDTFGGGKHCFQGAARRPLPAVALGARSVEEVAQLGALAVAFRGAEPEPERVEFGVGCFRPGRAIPGDRRRTGETARLGRVPSIRASLSTRHRATVGSYGAAGAFYVCPQRSPPR